MRRRRSLRASSGSSPCACRATGRTRSGRCRRRARRGDRATPSSGSGRSWRSQGVERHAVERHLRGDAQRAQRHARRAAARRDRSRRSARRTSPGAVTRRRPTTRVERLPKRTPVPCVAVASAPASACVSMSPWFSSASPWRAFCGPSAWSLMPASTVTRPDGAIGGDHALHPRGVDQQPVGAGDVGERVPAAHGAHPQPAGRRARPRRCASSSSLVGRTISAGAQR